MIPGGYTYSDHVLYVFYQIASEKRNDSNKLRHFESTNYNKLNQIN